MYTPTVSQVEWDALLKQQEELESSALSEGAARFRRRLEQAAASGQGSTVGAAKRLLKDALDPMTKAVQSMIDQPSGRGYGRRHVAAMWCERLGAETAAYLTLRVALSGKPGTPREKAPSLQDAAATVASLMVDELRYRRFREEAPHLFEYKLKSFHTSSYTHMARSLNASMMFAKINTKDLDLSPSMRLLLGTKLLDLLMESTGLMEKRYVELPARRKKQRTTIVLDLTDKWQEWIGENNETLEAFQPITMPMVVPPLAWGPQQIGGYRHALRNKFTLVRRKDATKQNSPVVFETLNALQNTAWRINPHVLALVKQIIASGGGVAGVPQSSPERLPAKPHDIETNEEARKVWRKAAHLVKERNHLRQQRLAEVYRLLSASEKVAAHAAIYFPHSLDFRGRIYPITAWLNPQGTDLSRALLTFADGKPIDDGGVKWLAIHGANCLGETPDGQKVSKLTLHERCQWVIAHTPSIITVADHPLAETWWAKAEDPLQFYAFCVEWTNLVRARDRGEEYVCSLPCSMDGSCNGLQHFSAMLADERGGKAVNLVAQDTPQDIYQRVADVVLRELETSDDPMATLWLGLHVKLGVVNRKLCKRPTMTFSYGSKVFGFKQQLKEYLRGLDEWQTVRAHFVIEEDGKTKNQIGKACALMASLIWNALAEVVVSAFGGMAWLQRAARGIVAENKPVTWTVPITGFVVRQDYRLYTRQRIRTVLAGAVVRPSVWNETNKLDPIKQANAVAPNVIHSLDAAALMLTVKLAQAEGVEQFSMIHDSYGTLPSDCSALAHCCRQAFVTLYREVDVIADLYSQFAAQYTDPTQCPEPPTKGDLDLSQVLVSDYFFA